MAADTGEVLGDKDVIGSMIRAVAAAGVLVASALLLAACGGGSAQADCGSVPSSALTPPGTGAAAYTMGIRVNQASDVAEVESAIGDRVLPRDVFVVNTEFPGSGPGDWEDTVAAVTERFPCNRISSLSGLGTSSEKAGYAFALAGHPDVDAILLDWEPDTWEDAGKGAWTADLESNLTRIGAQLDELSKRLESTKTRMGLVPDYLPPWDYGRTARVIALANFELDPAHRGFQVIQSQPNCGTPSAPGPLIGGLTADLVKQYRSVFGLPLQARGGGPRTELNRELLQHLGFEVAFSETPNPHASEAVDRIGPERAAACSDQIVRAGGAGILYWATPQSLRAMLETETGRSLRPAS